MRVFTRVCLSPWVLPLYLSLRYKAAAAVLLMLVLQVLIVERESARARAHTPMFVWCAAAVHLLLALQGLHSV